jgi:hypothetical protein
VSDLSACDTGEYIIRKFSKMVSVPQNSSSIGSSSSGSPREQGSRSVEDSAGGPGSANHIGSQVGGQAGGVVSHRTASSGVLSDVLSRDTSFPDRLFKTALRSSSVCEWLDAAAKVSRADSEGFAKRLAAVVERDWFVPHARRVRAVKLLGFVEGGGAREIAAAVLTRVIAGSCPSAEPERFLLSRRRFQNASAAIDAATQLGGDCGLRVLSIAFGARNRDLVIRAIYPLAAMSAGPGGVLRALVTFAEEPGKPAKAVQDALAAIGTLKEEHAAPFLIRMLSYGGEAREDLRTRLEAGRALGAMAQRLSNADVEAIGELLHHSRASVKAAACYALLKFGQEARPALVSISRALDDHPPERFSLRLLEIVMKIKRPESRALLLSVKTDPRAPRVVRRAAERYWGQVS